LIHLIDYFILAKGTNIVYDATQYTQWTLPHIWNWRKLDLQRQKIKQTRNRTTD